MLLLSRIFREVAKMAQRKPAFTLLELADWSNNALLSAITKRLEKRFGTLPTHGILAGQAVASACYEVVGLGHGPMNDLDWFCETEEADRFHNVVQYRNVNVPNDRVDLFVGRCSFSDGLNISAVNKGGYMILFSGELMSNRDINIVGCKSANSGETLTGEIVIAGFDINAVEIAIDLNEGKVVWSAAFQDFLYSKKLRVTRGVTPMHTVLRLIKKTKDIGFASVDLDHEIWLLKMARQLGVMLESKDENYLATQIFSEETVKKNKAIIERLSDHYTVEKVVLSFWETVRVDDNKAPENYDNFFDFDGDSASEIEVRYENNARNITFYKLMPRGLSEEDLELCKSVINLFRFCSMNTKLDAYRRASGLLFREIRTRVSRTAEEAHRSLLELIEKRDRDTVISEASVKNFFDRYRIDYQGVLERYTLVVKWLLCRDKHLAHKVVRRDIKNILKLMLKHINLFSDYVNQPITQLAVVADNVRWLDKRGNSFIAGLFESGSEDVRHFEPLDSRRFKANAQAGIESFYSIAKGRQFVALTEYLPNFNAELSKREHIEIRALRSQLHFLLQGEEEQHCVGGYYSECAEYRAMVLDVKNTVTGERATAMYEVDWAVVEGIGGIRLLMRQFYGKGNTPVADNLDAALPSKWFEAVEPDALPEPLRKKAKNTFSFEEIEFEDEIPW